jgi:hypothetical protein
MAKQYHELTSAEKRNGWIAMGVIAVIVIVLLKLWFSEEEKPELIHYTPAQRALMHHKLDALINSQSFIEKQFESLAGTEFSFDTSGVEKYDDSTFVVNSYVYAPNDSGIKSRINYKVILYYDYTDNVQCQITKFEQQ